MEKQIITGALDKQHKERLESYMYDHINDSLQYSGLSVVWHESVGFRGYFGDLDEICDDNGKAIDNWNGATFDARGKQITKFMQEMTIVAEAVSRAFDPEKMNYELLGMGDAHLHWHLYPRRTGDIEDYGNHGKGPVWWYPMEKMYSDDCRPNEATLEDMKRRLRAQLDLLTDK